MHVNDGDSFKVEGQKYRLFGIDAFGLNQTCNDLSGISYPCGMKAKQALKELIGKAENLDCMEKNVDRYGRSVSICSVGGQDIGDQMVRQGWALNYQTYSRGLYLAAEMYARKITTAHGLVTLKTRRIGEKRSEE